MGVSEAWIKEASDYLIWFGFSDNVAVEIATELFATYGQDGYEPREAVDEDISYWGD